jgi:DNA polymerase elongation subunit (family B)
MIGFPSLKDINDNIVDTIMFLIEKEMNKYFNKPHKLEYEKRWKPSIFVSKKKYAGTKSLSGSTDTSLDISGLQIVKRNYPKACQESYKNALLNLYV